MIHIDHLNVFFESQKRPSLDIPALDIPSGSFVSIIGPNGSGKSTLLRCMAGILPYEGEILLENKPLRSLHRLERARLVAYLPQSRPIPQIDVRTLVAHGRFPHLGFSKKLRPEDEEAIASAAAQTDVTGLMDKEVAHLSGGERQRVYLAMIIAQNADTILLDEPATYLDIRYQLDVLEILQRLHEQGKTILMVAHDLPQAFTVATDVLLIHKGQAKAFAPPAQLQSDPVLRQSFDVALTPDAAEDAIYHYRLSR